MNVSQAILVTAGTGTVGRHVVTGLRDGDTDATVRVATRDPAATRDHFGDAVEAVDFARPETWGEALADVDGVFLVRPPGVAVDELTAFVDAATRVRAEQVAYLSTLGADKNPLLPHHRIHNRIVDAGIDYTFLRASVFAQNLREVHGRDVVERDEIFVPAGSGETSFVDARDVGAVGALVLRESGHENVAYDLTGPATLTYHEVAAAFSDVLSRPITYADPSVVAFVRRMHAQELPLEYVLLMVGIDTTARLGLAGRVTDDVARLLGRSPRSVHDYVEEYADRFRPADA